VAAEGLLQSKTMVPGLRPSELTRTSLPCFVRAETAVSSSNAPGKGTDAS